MATSIRFGGYQGAASVHTRAIAVFARAVCSIIPEKRQDEP
jgi:hypothetical protein